MSSHDDAEDVEYLEGEGQDEDDEDSESDSGGTSDDMLQRLPLLHSISSHSAAQVASSEPIPIPIPASGLVQLDPMLCVRGLHSGRDAFIADGAFDGGHRRTRAQERRLSEILVGRPAGGLRRRLRRAATRAASSGDAVGFALAFPNMASLLCSEGAFASSLRRTVHLSSSPPTTSFWRCFCHLTSLSRGVVAPRCSIGLMLLLLDSATASPPPPPPASRSSASLRPQECR